MKNKVVIIDDDEDDIDILIQAIEQVSPDVNCDAFRYPAEAVMSLTDASFSDIPSHIFIDYNMPRMNGIECVLALRNDGRFDNTVITLVSTGMDQLDKKLYGNMGVTYWFSKPPTFDAYTRLLKQVFA